MLIALVVSLTLSAEPQSQTVKELVKEAVTQPNDGPDVSGMPFTPESIKTVVVHYQPKIQGCYEEYLASLKTKKPPEGKVVTSFIITGEGFVKKAAVNKKTSAVKNAAMYDCMVAVISTMVFPKPPDGKDQPIEYPFNLKAVH